ncbi:ferredoxin--nitrite reductase [Prochlorococcus sp. MIT 1223]|uniref:ferredoxin--nitrite reductase n=1 Tax=Prochlorococcus sp. MIT 1223 TaxID=3096217 RepID=UPI002A756DD0|nr:ferredoxin--nitrite reductase [Prochlorococcus sp. MIT 1223]
MTTISKPLKYYLKDKKLNKIEKDKHEKDGLEVGSQLEEFARLGWENIDKTDLQLRLKWYGMFWRPKTPGKFMLRLRIPNGVLNSIQLSIIASIVARYGENGNCDITTRQNLQLRGILISDLPEILRRLKLAGIETIQSGFDNPRNVTGNPLAGVDPEEVIDTRPYTFKLNEFLTKNGQGNPEFSNLPRKWNTAVAGASDNFLLHNDLVFHPVFNNGELGFSVWVGGILSSVLNDYAIPLNAWIQEDQICQLTQIILTIWRDNGERSARPKGRFRSYLNQIGIEKFRSLVEEKFGELQEDPGSYFSKKPRSFFGINNQKQEGKFYAGIHVPVGRLTSNDLQDLSDLINKYGTGELRLTEDQNIIIIDIPEENLFDFKNDNLLRKFPLNPRKVSAGTVSCTGKTYCGFALVNTKDQAQKIAEELDNELILPEELKIHWTGCPNSCGQAYMGAIGLTGKRTKDKHGKTVEAFDIAIGGMQGPVNKVGKLHKKSVPIYELKDTIKQLLIDNYKALPRLQNNDDFFSRFMNWFSELGEASTD